MFNKLTTYREAKVLFSDKGCNGELQPETTIYKALHYLDVTYRDTISC